MVLEGGLEVLDKTDADSNALIQHAAGILGVDLNTDDFDPAGAKVVRNNFTFRQQWVLRWITRKIHSELQSVNKTNEAAAGDISKFLYISNPRLWQLLVHVIDSIPDHTCVEILIERKFVQYIDQAICLILKSSTSYLSLSLKDDGSVVTSHGEGGVSTKRRRLSRQPDDNLHSSTASATSTALYLSVLRASYAIATVFGRENESGDSVAVWSQSAKDSSSMLSAVLELAYSATVNESLESATSKNILSLLGGLSSFWNHRPLVFSESARHEEVSLFYQRCLDPCLRLLSLINENIAADAIREARDALESLVAFNAVLPLRKNFFEKMAKSWKSHDQHMSWKTVSKAYNSFSRLTEQSAASETNMISVSWAQNACILYDVAIRLVPRADLKKRQLEQPWLDALLMFLSYLVCPRLTKFEVIQGQVEVVEPVIPTEMVDLPQVLDKLLVTAKKRTHRPSAQALSSLTYSIITWEGLERPWSSIAGLLDLDADVLVSNSGIVTTGLSLDALVRKLEVSSVVLEDYTVILHRIVKPLLDGHARSRALKQFISLWTKSLAEALRKTVIGLPPGQERAAVMVWQDEELFDMFADAYSLHGTDGLTKDLVSALQQDLQGLAGRIGSTLNTFSNVAIVNVVIESIQSADTAINPAVEKAIADSATAALKKRSDYQGQRWRLWKLIRCICSDDVLSELLSDLSNVTGGINSTSLSDLSKLSNDADLNNIPVSQYREVLEKFSCIASAATKATKTLAGSVTEEIAGLQLLLNSDPTRGLIGKAEIWNGRLEDLNSLPKLISACMGVILARPHLLKLVPNLAKDVEHLCADEQGISLLYQPFFEATSDLGHLQASGSGLDEWLAREGLAATSVSALQKLWQDLTRLGCSRAQAQTLSDKAFRLLKSSGGAMPVQALAYLGATMDRIGSKYAVPYTRADAWADWLNLLETLDAEHQGGLTKDHLHAAHSFSNIFRLVWENCQSGQSLQDILSHLSSQSKAHSKERQLPRPLSPWIAFQIAVPSLMATAKQSKDTELIIRQYTKRTHKNLNQLTVDLRPSEGLTEDWLVKAAFFLEAILEVAPLLPNPDQDKMRSDALKLQKHLYSCECHVSLSALLMSVQSKCDQLCGKLGIVIDSQSLPHHLETISPSRDPETWQELEGIGSRARSLISRLDTEGRGHLLSLISQAAQKRKLGVLQPMLVASVVLQTSSDQLARFQPMIASLDQIASLEDGLTAQQPLQLALSVENSRLVLDHLPEVVNQNTIDTLLARLCVILSPGKAFKTGIQARLFHPDAIFDRICALISSLLSRYRRRLADRQHLLVAVAQGLLKCLFFPGASAVESKHAALTTYSTSFFHSLPWWLTASENPLGRGSAAKFSRILSMICNPTVSAAKSSRKRNHNELNDEIKRVKALAGQHMQYLVMEYARCSLDGEIKVEVKEKLMTGMYIVLDAMGREVMRAMNAAMDPSSRAIFKTLYDDWLRYGKWDNS